MRHVYLSPRILHSIASHNSSSSPRAFPIIWGRRNGYEYHSSTLSCPVRPPPLTPHLSLCTSLSTWFSVFFLSISFLLLMHLTFFISMCPSSLLLTCPYHFRLFSVIFFVTELTIWSIISTVVTLCSITLDQWSQLVTLLLLIPLTFKSYTCTTLFWNY